MTRKEDILLVEMGGLRLDRFVADKVEGFSRSYLKELIERGCVLVDGVRRQPDYRLQTGELVKLAWPESSWSEQPIAPWILHEDRHLLVLHKPAGLLMHPLGESWVASPKAALTEHEPNLAGLLLAQRPETSRGLERCGLVHRLDRQTSGVLLVAKTPAAQAALHAAFREREVHKVYRAIVLGEMASTTVDAPVGRISGVRRVRVTQWGREAQTLFRAYSPGRGVSLVSAEPKTGRTHQIRAHLAAVGHPVLGDAEWFGLQPRAVLRALGHEPPPRMMLHAWRIRFTHPGTGKAVSYTAPPPKDFRDYWAKVKK
ncbi:MAG TPA: RluA family pseudouridine synthase [Elusimicrobia bacterium]|nr:RluA family pseudouridine synthase [Elusimicrobiota bacterium]